MSFSQHICVRYIEFLDRKFSCREQKCSIRWRFINTVHFTVMPASLNTKLKELRAQKGFSLDELAEKTETSKSYLWELENRNTRKPSAEKLARIAQELGVTTEYLLDDDAPLDDSVIKTAFFRKFNRLSTGDQRKIENIIDTWSKHDQNAEQSD